jgi:phage tail sheath protein FI
VAQYKRPGAYINEALLSQDIFPAGENDAVGCLVGPLSKGPAVATKVATWSEYQRKYGTYTATDYVGFAAYLYFANGGRPLYVLRVPGTGSTVASTTLTDRGNHVTSATVSSRVVDGTTATITTAAAHTFVVGDVVTQTGFAGTDITAGLNGTFTITATPSSTTYQFLLAATVTTGVPASAATPSASVPRPYSTLTINSANVGSWGNSLRVEVTDSAGGTGFDVTVYSGGSLATNVVETFRNLQMDSTLDRYAPSVINASSNYITAVDAASISTGTARWPSASGVKSLASGTDGTAATDYATALTLLDTVTDPLIINLPGSSNITLVNEAINYAAARGDCFVVADTAAGTTPSAATTYATTLSSSSYGACYYPWLAVPDPLSSVPGVLRYLPPGGAVLGQFMSSDVANGVWKAPAGITNTITGPVATERLLSSTDLDTLNTGNAPVNAIRQLPTSGICIMGARTLNQSAADRYVNVRRTLIYLKRELKNRTQFALFRNNDQNLWDDVVSSLTNFLTQVWQQGGLAGATAADAFYVVCNSTVNTAATVTNGELHITIGVALEYPAEFVVITLGQIQGSTSINEA